MTKWGALFFKQSWTRKNIGGHCSTHKKSRSAPDRAGSSHIRPMAGVKKFLAVNNPRLHGKSQSY
jgi:hypothetical protein